MVTFARTTPPPKVKNSKTPFVALALAGLCIVMAVGQLYAFEEFVPLLTSFGLGGGEARATVIASLLVTGEVFALPFLLRMHVSPLMRIVSMVAGWLVSITWIYITVSVALSVNAVNDAGFLGGALALPFGWWSVAYVVLLALLTAWVSWKMWPSLRIRARLQK